MNRRIMQRQQKQHLSTKRCPTPSASRAVEAPPELEPAKVSAQVSALVRAKSFGLISAFKNLTPRLDEVAQEMAAEGDGDEPSN